MAVFSRMMEREYREKQYAYDASIYSSFASLMLRILRIWHCQGISLDLEASSETEENRIQDILVYIDRHSQENINIEELAHHYNMSYSYFAKMFLKYYGQSCKQYIEFIRLNKVENFLLFTDYDLNYIAAETGFADCSHLIRTFKKHYQITPKQFRLRSRTIGNGLVQRRRELRETNQDHQHSGKRKCLRPCCGRISGTWEERCHFPFFSKKKCLP